METKPLITTRELQRKELQNKLPEIRQNIIYGTGCLFELTRWINVFVITIALIHFFVATIFIVDGASMEPNFSTGEYIIANRWQYIFGKPERGDVVVLKFPGDPEHKKYIKRIVGVPGDTLKIRDGMVYINNIELKEKYIPTEFKTYPNVDWRLTNNDYFLMGDNRINSNDSRHWGIADKRFLIGKAWVQIFPHWRVIEKPKYNL